MKKKKGVWFSLFHEHEHNHNFHNLQPILDCNMLKFKLKYQQFKNGKTKLVSELASLLFLNKRVSFFGTPGSTSTSRSQVVPSNVITPLNSCFRET